MDRKQYIWKFFYKHKYKFLCELICIIIMTVVGSLYPFLNGKIVDAVFYEKNISIFLDLCLIYMGLFLVNQFVVATINSVMWTNLMTSFVFDIRREIFNKILRLKGKNLSKVNSGDIIRRMNNDAEEFMFFILNGILWGLAELLELAICMFFLFYYNIYLGIMTVIMIPIVFATSLYFKKKVQIVNEDIAKEKGRLSSFLFEFVRNSQEVKILKAVKNVIGAYLNRTIFIYRKKIKSEKIEFIGERTNSFILLFSQLIIFTICALFILNDNMQLGDFVAAISYFTAASSIFIYLNGRIVDMGKQLVCIQRIVDLLNESEEDYNENGVTNTLTKGKIEFVDVAFGYEDKENVLKNINLVINGHSKIALVGRTGSGKTTMINLINRLYTPTSGKIIIDGKNINEFNLHNLRSQIGVVYQECIIFEGTLRYNLCFSNEKQNDEILMEAIKKAAFYGVYLLMENGLDTILGVNGHNLSGGEKQRLAFARIFVKNPKILIFDEATSNIDAPNEDIIKHTLDELSKDKTLIIIAHRFLTIKNCDKVAVLSNGEIESIDNLENLLVNNKHYNDLFHKQYFKAENISTSKPKSYKCDHTGIEGGVK